LSREEIPPQQSDPSPSLPWWIVESTLFFPPNHFPFFFFSFLIGESSLPLAWRKTDSFWIPFFLFFFFSLERLMSLSLPPPFFFPGGMSTILLFPFPLWLRRTRAPLPPPTLRLEDQTPFLSIFCSPLFPPSNFEEDFSPPKRYCFSVLLTFPLLPPPCEDEDESDFPLPPPLALSSKKDFLFSTLLSFPPLSSLPFP